MKRALTLTGVLALLSSIVAVIAKLTPETFSSETFSFLEYMVRLFAMPLVFAILLCFVALAASATASGKTALGQLNLLPHLSGADLWGWIASVGTVAWIVFVASLALSVYGLLSYGRVVYVFGRDRLLLQYQREVSAKIELERSFRNVNLVKSRLRALQSVYWYNASGEPIESQIKGIDRLMEEIRRLVAVADQLGPNPRSLQLRALALTMNPWDEALAAKIRSVLEGDLVNIIQVARSTRDKCSTPNAISNQEASKTMVALGMQFKSELPKLTPKDGDGESLCRLVGDWSREKLKEYIDSVWQVKRITTMLEDVQLDGLSRRKREAWARWTTPGADAFVHEDYPFEEFDQEEPRNWNERVPVPRLMPPTDKNR